MDQGNLEFRRKILFVIAIASGILGIVLLNVYMSNKEAAMRRKLELNRQQLEAQRAAAQKKIVQVLVAVRNIQPQIPITSGDLGVKEVPEEYVQPGGVSPNMNILGMTASIPILVGEQILNSKLGPPPQKLKILSEITPPGKRAVPVMVDNITNLSGLLQPGDYVDVLAIISPPAGFPVTGLESGKQDARVVTMPLFQNILVLAIGSEFNLPGTATTAKKTGKVDNSVTLSLSPKEAALISFVQEQGKIRLLMRSNSDISEADVEAVNWDTLFDYLYPGARERGVKISPTVEIYRGLNKEVIPLSEGKKK
jgi:pilus assembly protein CpaB